MPANGKEPFHEPRLGNRYASLRGGETPAARLIPPTSLPAPR